MTAPVLDIQSGLYKTPYETAVTEKRIACFLSHYHLWKKCAESEESIFIFEHDAIFTRKVDIDRLCTSKYQVIGLNDPRGATRRSAQYHTAVSLSTLDIVPVPKIDDDKIPQGLAGNSAYFLKPDGAKKLLDLTHEYGAWPNDALMCKQLMPRTLGVVRKYCTKVQGVKSTTTL